MIKYRTHIDTDHNGLGRVVDILEASGLSTRVQIPAEAFDCSFFKSHCLLRKNIIRAVYPVRFLLSQYREPTLEIHYLFSLLHKNFQSCF